jgi:Tfp pilus assembly protein PilZ
MNEHSRVPRAPTPHILVKISSRERLKTSYLKDLSEGGVFVRTDKPLPIGREVVVDLLPPGWVAPLRLRGAVCRVQEQPPGIAITFSRTDEGSLAKVKALVAEYLEKGDEAQPAVSEAEQQLAHLLERYADVQNTAERQEAELATERARRTELTDQVAELALQLEAQRSGGSAEANAQATALQQSLVESGEAQREASELRTRISELEGELEAFKVELAQLEADDASSRKLAGLLAGQKAELTAEVARLGKLAAEVELLRGSASRAKDDREGLVAALQDAELERERRSAELARATARADAVTARNLELSARAAAAEAENAELRGTVGALERKNAQLEVTLKDLTARQDRLKSKERELRELLELVSARPSMDPLEGEDVILVSESSRSMIAAMPAGAGPRSAGEAPTSAGPPVGEAPAESGLARPVPSGATTGAGSTVEAAAARPGVDQVTAIDLAMAEPPLPLELPVPDPVDAPAGEAPFEASFDSGSVDLSVTIDLDDEPAPERSPSAASNPARQGEYERRLRANEALVKTANFDAYRARTEQETKVKGLLEAGCRFSELMVLGRGTVTPPELLASLVVLLDGGAVRFELA